MSKIALITGASSGIRKVFVKIHAQNGENSIIVARRKANLIELKKQIESTYNVEVRVIPKDLSKPEAAVELYLEKTELFKKVTSANKVALDGYNGMQKGKLNVVSGLTFLQK